jgi:hypothetical protein
MLIGVYSPDWYTYFLRLADAINAYAQASIREDEPPYIAVEKQMVDWWRDTHKKRITTYMLMMILMVLQGHPRAGKLWVDNVDGDLADLGFVPLKHEQYLYLGHYEGKSIIWRRQSDYFFFGGES